MTALRIARAATGRGRILKFEGCYHGHSDAMLAGSAPGSPPAGIPVGVAADTVAMLLDDVAALEQAFDHHGSQLAAAIIEPLPANHGLLPQRPEFLQRLHDLCTRHGALLIFDEVITGFRLAFGGCAETTGITPDLVTYGKIIGGGFPVGAVGGPRDLMNLLAPAGPVYQAGTLAANPVAMAAGLATLRKLADGRIYRELDALGAKLEHGLGGVALHLQRRGSIFWLYPGQPATPDGVIRAPAQMDDQALSRYQELFHGLLEQGIYLPPSPFEVGFLSAAHRASHIRTLVKGIRATPPADH
jgi:glutamate-1-semialdehyde 2,1-aminomutase